MSRVSYPSSRFIFEVFGSNHSTILFLLIYLNAMLHNYQEKVEQTEWDDIENVEELKTIVSQFEETLTQIRRKRNSSQIERDTLQSYYDITTQEYDNTKDKTKALDQQYERIENENNVEIQVYAHKVRHLEYEHKRKLFRIQQEKEVDIRTENQIQQETTRTLLQKRRALKDEIREMESMYTHIIEKLKLKNNEDLVKAKAKHESALDHLQKCCNERLEQFKRNLELQKKFHIHEVNERRNLFLHELDNNQKDAIDEMNSYYNSIFKENAIEIQRLQNAIETSERKSETYIEISTKTAQENKDLSEPLKSAKENNLKLLESIRHKEKDKQSLINTKNRLSMAYTKYKKLSKQYQKLANEYNTVVKELDDQYNNFDDLASDVCEKNRCKTIILEHYHKKISKNIETLKVDSDTTFEKKKTPPSQRKNHNSNYKSHKSPSNTTTIEKMLHHKNAQIDKLLIAVAKASKQYSDKFNQYREKISSIRGMNMISNEEMSNLVSILKDHDISSDKEHT